MSDHITEEEQIEAIKRWLSENWVSIVLPIALVLVGYVSWNFWGDYKTNRASAASEQYQLLVDALNDTTGNGLSDKAIETARSLADGVLSQYQDTLYADLTNLIVAKLDVDAGELDAAKTRLQAVVSQHAAPASLNLAKARLAKVELALGNYDQALTYVNAADSDSSKALYAEIRGDIYSAKGDMDAANTAYKDALINLTQQQQSRSGLLQLKIDATSKPVNALISEMVDAQSATTHESMINKGVDAAVLETAE